MKPPKLFCASLLAISLALFATLSAGEEQKRSWETAFCFHFSLTVWDKQVQDRYSAKYVVTATDGSVFVAEKSGVRDSDTAQVIFPDNFRDQKTNLKAWVNCSYGETYNWEVYVNGALVESGRFAVSKKKSKVSNTTTPADYVARTLM
ncbi:MAG: hypothetical protein Q7U91_08845 [Sideroxyarcus sp.]|nr:hypothetical protein [Sideroxyarcus sp.]